MALRHAAVLTNPGSYVMSPASSADVLICRRSMARTVPSWTGSSYCFPVRLSTTVRVSLGTRGVLDFGWGKITSEGGEGRWKAVSAASVSAFHRLPPPCIFASHDPPHTSETRQPLPHTGGSGRPAGPTARRPGLHRVPAARDHARGGGDRRQRRQGDGGPVRRAGRRLHQARLERRADRGDRRVRTVRDGPRLPAERSAAGQAGNGDRRVPRPRFPGSHPVPHAATGEDAGREGRRHRGRSGRLPVEGARGGEGGGT